MDRFSEILYDLGKEIGVELYPDQNRICELNYDDQFSIQLTYDETKEELTLATFICDVPPGKYREKLLSATLTANGEFPRVGTFGYSERNNKLTLFATLPSEKLRSDILFSFLEKFIEKTHSWKDAVENGKPFPITTHPKKGDKGMFGLKS